MKSNRVAIFVIMSALFFSYLTSAADSEPILEGWYLSGKGKEGYTAFLDTSSAYDGSGSAYLASVENNAGLSFGTVMQWTSARPYQGKRLKFAGFVKTKNVITRAALWMRVDGHAGQVLRFDNMSGRPSIRGTSNWTKYEVILDIPLNSKRIAYGVLLRGTGEVWFDSVFIETVYTHEAVTALPGVFLPIPFAPDELPEGPVNLNFEPEF